MNEIRCKEIKRGKSPTYITNSNIFVFAQKCNSKYNGIDLSLCKCLDPTKFRNYDRSEVMLPGDIIINSTGTGTLGRIGYLSDSDNINNLTLVPDSHVTVVRLSNELNSYFMKVTVNLYHKYFEEHGEGSTNQKELKPLTIQTILVPIPPRNEQNRIVNKLKELNPLIEKYKLAEEKLYELNSNIKGQLKKSILQYAIEGKLVPQDLNDEPASVLLDRIRKEKQNLIAEGKIKKDKNESIIYRRDNSYYEKLGKKEVCIDDSIYFDIPDDWQWCRIGTIFQHNTGKALNSSNKDGAKKKYITTSNLYWDYFKLDNLKEMYFKISELEKCSIKKGDLLVCEGGDVGRAAIWNEDYSLCIQNHIHRLRPYINIPIKYFYYIFYLYKFSGRIGGKGIGIKGLSSNSLHSLLIPIPPLAIQKRIVYKYEQILTILS